jgi:hypothetical protein
MTQDEIIEMARQAGYFLYDLTETHGKKTVETDENDEWAQLVAFTKLVAAKAIAADELEKKRTWVGLTDEERSKIWGELPQTSNEERDACIFAQAIEAKLKEKNT